MPTNTIPSRLFQRARHTPDAPAYFEKSRGVWRGSSWAEYAELVKKAGKSLIKLGVGPGGSIAILGFNRPEWVIADVACMAVGGAPAGIYTTCSPSEVQYITQHCEAPVVLVENEEQWKKVDKERARLPLVKKVVTMRGAPRIDDPLVATWEQFLELGKDVSDADFFARIDALEPDQLATLIYTSGTTGPPKGVMLSHRNLSWTADCTKEMTQVNDSDVVMSYLPLSHIAEQMFSIHGAIGQGMAVYYAESIDKVLENLKEVRPTVFFAVPRIWEKFHQGIGGRMRDATGAKKRIADWATKVGAQVSELKFRGREPQGLLRVQYAIANRLVFSKLKAAVGLDRARICVSGAAPVAREVLEFLATLDVIVNEVYGQSEDTGPTSFNLPGAIRLGSVGRAIPGVQVKIAEDGEILVKGPNVFLGYYKEPQATAETLIDGWLHSGDLGAFDQDGFLHITGRKKEIIITAGGKNIAPKNIEAALKNHRLINEAVVIGDRRKFLTALVTLDPEETPKFLAENGLPAANPHENARIIAEVQKAIDEVNQEFARVEQVKKFKILPRNLSVQDGELTPTLKVKRKAVNEHFATDIESMYSE